jgi:hypothetical protein
MMILRAVVLFRRHLAGLLALLVVTAGCGTGSLILWNPRTGLCDEVPKAAAYAMGGGALRYDAGRGQMAV